MLGFDVASHQRIFELHRDRTRYASFRCDRDVANGMLPQNTDIAPLAGLVMTVMQGMSVMTRDGATRTALLAIADAALAAWPAPDLIITA